MAAGAVDREFFYTWTLPELSQGLPELRQSLPELTQTSKITVCDTCAADLLPKLPFATLVQRIRSSFNIKTCKNNRLRHLCSGFGAQIAICDTCAADLVVF